MTRPRSKAGSWARTAGLVLASLITLGCGLWAFGAIWFDSPVAHRLLAAIFAAVLLALVLGAKGKWMKLGVVLIAFAAVLGWWLTLSPRNDRSWQPDVDRTTWAEVGHDQITFHNVRNCDYRTETEFTPRWETRTVRLSELTGIDLAINYWGSPYMAHPIASFQFASSPPLCFSIETRKEVGEVYSAVGGLYRQFELIYVVADERDVIRLRSNFRRGEDVYLYRLNIAAAAARQRLLEYITALNQLHHTPMWYNAVTTNCTTAIRVQRSAAERAPWDWRMLVNGFGDEMLFERGGFVTDGLTFAELKRQALVNAAAQAAANAEDFSQRIRFDRAGFGK